MGIYVAAIPSARRKISQEVAHRSHPEGPEVVDRRDGVPDELARIASSLLQDLVVVARDLLFDLVRLPTVNGIDRDNPCASSRPFRIEAGRTIPAANDAQAELDVRQRKHSYVLVKGPPPRHDL